MVQGRGPKFKPQNHNKKKKERKERKSSYINFRADFRARKIIRDIKGVGITYDKEVNSQENTSILNVYMPNNRASKCEAKSDRTPRRKG
jgi:hypothetical protein